MCNFASCVFDVNHPKQVSIINKGSVMLKRIPLVTKVHQRVVMSQRLYELFHLFFSNVLFAGNVLWTRCKPQTYVRRGTMFSGQSRLAGYNGHSPVSWL